MSPNSTAQVIDILFHDRVVEILSCYFYSKSDVWRRGGGV